jgi:uncharacterized protein
MHGAPPDEDRDAPGGRAADAGKSPADVQFAGLALTLDASGAAYAAEHGTLIVADLHLEKGSRWASKGRLLPALDSRDTLERLRGVTEAYRPHRVICLGDSFDDARAGERMADEDRRELTSLCASVARWTWLGGNHDPETPDFCGGESLPEARLGGVLLRHEPRVPCEEAQIVGHLHPKASVAAGGYRISGPVFCVSEELLILPAFGAYAGGLSCGSEAIRSLLKSKPKLYMLHGGKIWRAG